MDQQLFNYVVGLCGLLAGWILKAIWGSVRDLQVADKELTDEVGKIKVLVAGLYVPRADFDRAIETLTNLITSKLDKLNDKLEKKVDRI